MKLNRWNEYHIQAIGAIKPEVRTQLNTPITWIRTLHLQHFWINMDPSQRGHCQVLTHWITSIFQPSVSPYCLPIRGGLPTSVLMVVHRYALQPESHLLRSCCVVRVTTWCNNIQNLKWSLAKSSTYCYWPSSD